MDSKMKEILKNMREKERKFSRNEESKKNNKNEQKKTKEITG